MYTIKNFKDETVINIEDKAKDNSTSLTFFGRGSTYGEAMNQNMLRLMEHFSSSDAKKPSNPVKGQIWFNLTTKVPYIWDDKWIALIYGGPKSLTWDKTSFTQTIDGINSKYNDKITITGNNVKFVANIPNDAYTITTLPTGLTANVTSDNIKNEVTISLSGQTLKNYSPSDIKITIAFNIKAFTNVTDVSTVANLSNKITIPYAAVTNANPTGSVTLSGINKKGETLTVSNDLNDPDTIVGVITYKWYINGVNLTSNDNKTTYIVQESDATKPIKVVAHYKDGLNKIYDIDSNIITIEALPVPSLTWKILTPFEEKAANDGTFSGKIQLDLVNCKASTTFNYATTDAITFTNNKDIALAVVSISDVTIVKDASSTDTKLIFTIDGLSSQPDKNVTSTLSINSNLIDGLLLGTKDITITMIAASSLAWTILTPFTEVSDGTLSGTIKIVATNCKFNSIADYSNILTLSTVKNVAGAAVMVSSVTSSKVSQTLTELQLLVSIVIVAHDKDIVSGLFTLLPSAVDVVTDMTDDTFTATMMNNLVTGTVTISGDPYVGELLTSNNTLADTDGLGTLNYQWLRDGAIITGATNTTYTTVAADLNTSVSLKISYTDGNGNGNTESKISTPINIIPMPINHIVLNNDASLVSVNENITVTDMSWIGSPSGYASYYLSVYNIYWEKYDAPTNTLSRFKTLGAIPANQFMNIMLSSADLASIGVGNKVSLEVEIIDVNGASTGAHSQQMLITI